MILVLLLALMLIGLAVALAIRASLGAPNSKRETLAQVCGLRVRFRAGSRDTTASSLQSGEIATRIGLHLIRVRRRSRLESFGSC